MTRKSYIVTVDDDQAWIRHTGKGEYVTSLADLESVIKGLTKLSNTNLLNQETLRHNFYSVRMNEILLYSEWNFDMENIVTKQCVYVADFGYENALKIGATKDLSTRLKKLQTEYLDIKPKPICQIITRHYLDLEFYMKQVFKKHNKMGEFFDRTSIEYLIGYYKQELNYKENT
jgi:hypothetical protein